MDKLKAFDNFALEYDKWFESHKVEYELELKAIRELLPKGGSGVEIGAGTGRFTHPLGISLGIEPSGLMRDIAGKCGVNIIEGKAELLPIEDDSYDYALLTTTVCFLDAPEIAFSEVLRVLRSGGYILVGLIDKNSNLGSKYEEKKSESKFYKEATFHSVEEIQIELTKLGFGNFEYVQAVLPGDICKSSVLGVKRGYGEGSFVVLRAQKPNV